MNKKQKNYTIKKIEEYKAEKEECMKDAGSEMIWSAIATAATVGCLCNDHKILGAVAAVATVESIISSIGNIIISQGCERDIRCLEYSLEMDKLETGNQEVNENTQAQSKVAYSKNLFKRDRR